MTLANARGFTLFETLVATMIFATALVIILQLFSGGLRANSVSGQYTQAVFHAREKMEEILLADEMIEQTLDGQWDDGFLWKAKVTLQDAMDDKGNQNLPVPFQVDLEIIWREGEKQREIALSTVTLRKAAIDGKEEPTPR
jgi:prepilin-type N-terminal cleavage/methylation domain-containing protein